MEKSDGSCPETEKIGKLMGKYAIPCIISLLVGAVALILVEFFPQQLINVFGAANESVYYTDNLFDENVFLFLFSLPSFENREGTDFFAEKTEGLRNAVLHIASQTWDLRASTRRHEFPVGGGGNCAVRSVRGKKREAVFRIIRKFSLHRQA